MRTLLLSLLLMAWLPDGRACSCFPPEVRAKTAEDALRSARLAVYARVMDVSESGQARLRVLESFKGPAKGDVIQAERGAGSCDTPSFAAGNEVLLLAFAEPATACDQLPPEHFLLEAFRANAAKMK
jgi:hypothetical protein